MDPGSPEGKLLNLRNWISMSADHMPSDAETQKQWLHGCTKLQEGNFSAALKAFENLPLKQASKEFSGAIIGLIDGLKFPLGAGRE